MRIYDAVLHVLAAAGRHREASGAGHALIP
jgi:hypothetical protein